MNKYYVYTHSDMSGNVFYIGKGTGNRAYSMNRTKEWKEKVKKLNGKYIVDLPYGNLTNEEALDCEALLIKLYGFDNLVNKIKTTPKSSSTAYYRFKVYADFIDTCCEIYSNYDYYKKDKSLMQLIDDTLWVFEFGKEIRNEVKLLNT